jgi:hypothetical protein
MANNKKNTSSSLVPANTSELSVQFDDAEMNENISSALEMQKEQIILQEASKLNMVMLDGDVRAVKENLIGNYGSLAKLRVAAIRELHKYQEMIDLAVKAEVNLNMQKIAEIQNNANQRELAQLKELERFTQENLKQWEQIVEDTKRIFDTSKIADLFDDI